MYHAFYSLAATPFSKENKNSFVSKSFKEAVIRLEYLQKTRGMGLMTGESGAGKTFVLRSFVSKLNQSLYKVVYFPLSTGTVTDFYRGLALKLGEEPCFRKVELFEQIQKRIINLFKQKKVTPVLILDEMHMAPNKMLLDLSLLFNFYMDSLNPFILILAGLPSLQNRLGMTQNQPLNQRIIMRYLMEPLQREEVKQYILYNLEQAGMKHPLFTEDALEAVASLSQGWPRIINNICENSLLLGTQMRKKTVDSEIVRLAAQETGM